MKWFNNFYTTEEYKLEFPLNSGKSRDDDFVSSLIIRALNDVNALSNGIFRKKIETKTLTDIEIDYVKEALGRLTFGYELNEFNFNDLTISLGQGSASQSISLSSKNAQILDHILNQLRLAKLLTNYKYIGEKTDIEYIYRGDEREAADNQYATYGDIKSMSLLLNGTNHPLQDIDFRGKSLLNANLVNATGGSGGVFRNKKEVSQVDYLGVENQGNIIINRENIIQAQTAISDNYRKINTNKNAIKINKTNISTNTTNIETNKNNIVVLDKNKQHKLIAGDNITIADNVISSTGGGEPTRAQFANGFFVDDVEYRGIINSDAIVDNQDLIRKNEDAILLKQDILIAGENITIIDNTISATGGGTPTPAIFKSGEEVKAVDYLGLINEDNIKTNALAIADVNSELVDYGTLIDNNKAAILLKADLEDSNQFRGQNDFYAQTNFNSAVDFGTNRLYQRTTEGKWAGSIYSGIFSQSGNPDASWKLDYVINETTNEKSIVDKQYIDKSLLFPNGINIAGSKIIDYGAGAMSIETTAGVPTTLSGATPITGDDFTTKNYVDTSIANIPVSTGLELLLSLMETANNDISTYKQYTLPERVNNITEFVITVKNIDDPQGITTFNIKNSSESYGQGLSTGNYLFSADGNIIVKIVNVSGGGSTGKIWFYTNGAIQKIFGLKGAVLRTRIGREIWYDADGKKTDGER